MQLKFVLQTWITVNPLLSPPRGAGGGGGGLFKGCLMGGVIESGSLFEKGDLIN